VTHCGFRLDEDPGIIEDLQNFYDDCPRLQQGPCVMSLHFRLLYYLGRVVWSIEVGDYAPCSEFSGCVCASGGRFSLYVRSSPAVLSPGAGCLVDKSGGLCAMF
jgi:hypothetical protein